MSRDDFLARVRQAAQAGRAYRVHVDQLPPGTGYVGPRQEDLCAAMAAEVDEVGGHAHLVDGLDEARAKLRELLEKHSPRSVLPWQHLLLDRLRLGEMLTEMDIESLNHETLSRRDATEQRAAVMAADVGVTSCDVAVAETGSLVVCSRPGQERIASLVTPVHIALVERTQIVPDLFDAFERLGATPNDLPSNISIITGPSKTGDIELTLTTGVHGPGTWHVIVIRST